MNILTIENDIITTLAAALPALKVEGFPENTEQYRLLHPKGAVLVRFLEAVYSAPQETAFTQQEAVLTFNLTLMVKGLRDKQEAAGGAYGYVDAINTALTGYAPTGCGRMYPVKERFVREKDGVLEYSLNFGVPVENCG